MPPKLNQDMEPTMLVGEAPLAHLEEVVPLCPSRFES